MLQIFYSSISNNIPSVCPSYKHLIRHYLIINAANSTFRDGQFIPTPKALLYSIMMNRCVQLYIIYHLLIQQFDQRIFTEVDLFNEQIQRELEDYASILYGYLDAVKKTLDDDVHIVFELVPWPEDEVKENEPLSHYICNYYLVKHGTRTVFWLDDFDASELPIWSEVSGVKSPAQVRKFPSNIPACNFTDMLPQ